MIQRPWLLVSLPLVCCVSTDARAQQGGVRNVHDPSIIRQGETYYVFSTGRGVPIRKSRDLLRWEDAGRVFPDGPPEWARREVPGARSLWAPDISFFEGEYHLYYSVSTFGNQRSCIGLATNKTLDAASPDYKWVDRGRVIESRPGRDDFNAIDPNVVLDERGIPWLSFGSFWGGIVAVRLDARTGMPAAEDGKVRHLASRLPPDAIEAPFIVRKGDYYYLFVSFDYCCRGARSDYNIVVGRSHEVVGPYMDRDGKSMTEGGGTPVLAGEGTSGAGAQRGPAEAGGRPARPPLLRRGGGGRRQAPGPLTSVVGGRLADRGRARRQVGSGRVATAIASDGVISSDERPQHGRLHQRSCLEASPGRGLR